MPTDIYIKKGNKKAIRFCLMVAGQAGLGKTTLLATLFDSHINPPVEESSKSSKSLVFTPTEDFNIYSFPLETEGGIRLTIDAIDTAGYGDDSSPLEQAEKLVKYIEGTFDEVFEEEQRIHRNPKFEEHRVHTLLYLVEPTALGLKKFDIDFMKKLSPFVNIIPLIAKADGLDEGEKRAFKGQILADIQKNEIKIFDFSCLSECDPNESEYLNSLVPFTVIGATFPHEDGKQQRGRQYPWGFVNVDDTNICDLKVLYKVLLQTARDELKEFTEDNLYESYRTSKLLQMNPVQ